MVKYENHCCDCVAGGYPCRGSECPLREVEIYVCDECGAELDDIYDDGDELCEECLLERYRRQL